MKLLIAILAICLGVVATTRAEAQNYPWCSYYTSGGGGGTNCGFTTFQQCLDNVRGIGGFCDRNTQYQIMLSSYYSILVILTSEGNV